MSWKSFPKIELHLHLEGAADPAFVRQLAKEKSVDVSGIFDENGAYKYQTLCVLRPKVQRIEYCNVLFRFAAAEKSADFRFICP